jgi:hypothetical protein
MRGLSIAVLLLAPTLAAAAPGDELLGKWRAVAIERDGKRERMPEGLALEVEFARRGVFTASSRRDGKWDRRKGTWSVKGKELTTVVDNKTERMTVALDGAKLRLSKTSPEQHLHLERAR